MVFPLARAFLALNLAESPDFQPGSALDAYN